MTGPGQIILCEPIPMVRSAEDELEVVVREHARFVYKVAYAVLRNHHDAEDAVQETFLKLSRQHKKWVVVRDQRAWLARMTWRVALNRRQVRPEVGLDEVADKVLAMKAHGASAEEIAATTEMQALLARLIAALPRDLRDVITLSSVDEMSSSEIAAVSGIPEGSVRTRLLRARALLREKLQALVERKHGR